MKAVETSGGGEEKSCRLDCQIAAALIYLMLGLFKQNSRFIPWNINNSLLRKNGWENI